jgi:beta-lactamase superfamily II metal-dependent hydrolase
MAEMKRLIIGDGDFEIVDETARNTANDHENRIVNVENAPVQFIFPKMWGAYDDVHAGDANLIVAYGKTILIDCHYTTFESDLLQMFSDNDISHLDYFILTHYHADHYGNISALIREGYIDTDTKVYLPANVACLDDTEHCQSENTGRSLVLSALSNANITSVVPSVGSRIVIKDFTLTFYNCDASFLDTTYWGYSYDSSGNVTAIDYNNYSTLCLIKHKKITALYTGDAGEDPLYQLYVDGYVTSHVDLYKIEHHGANYSDADKLEKFLDVIIPDYAVQPSSSGTAYYNKNGVVQTLSLLQGYGTKIYPVHTNENYIILESTGHTINVIQGDREMTVSSAYIIRDIYVDASVKSAIMDGTAEHPYKELNQALGAIDFSNNLNSVTIHLASGHYNSTSGTTAGKQRIRLHGAHVVISGNTNDPTDVVVTYGANIFCSSVIFENLTLDSGNSATSTNGVVAAYDSNITIRNCIISVNSALSMHGVYASRMSNIYIINSVINTTNHGITISASSRIHANNITFNNCDYAYVLSGNSLLYETGTVYSSVTHDKSFGSGSFEYGNEYYRSGDTFATNAKTTYSGLVTASAKSLLFQVPVNKSMDKISGVTVSNLVGGVRIPTGGYANYGASDTYDWLADSNVTSVVASVVSSKIVNIRINCSGEIATNNIPVIAYLEIGLTFN